MMRSRTLVCAALLIPFLMGARAPRADRESPRVATDGDAITSTGTAARLAARETAGPDTFVLYGGPDHPTEGKFQLVDGVTPDWGDGTGNLLPGNYGGGPGAWTSHDLSEVPNYWHRSQFKGETLGPAGNHVLWCGTGNGDVNEVPIGNWVDPPGYGNLWDVSAVFNHLMIDPSVGQTIGLDFDFSSDTEPGYDYFTVEYDSAGTWTEVLRVDGAYATTSYSAMGPRPIHYEPDSYGFAEGQSTPEWIRIRIRVRTDGGHSDEDGLWLTDGAAQVDNVALSFTDGVTVHELTEDFEAEQEYWEYLFVPDEEKFAGDFADVYGRFTDIDPCRDNNTPVIGFLDSGQTVRNWTHHPQYVVNGDSTTGGSLNANFAYGIPGSWVTNFTGGLSSNEARVMNEIWSPWIQWDLPTTADDDVAFAGSSLRWSVWAHLPLSQGIYYVWHVRTLEGTPGDALPGEWADRDAVYFGGSHPRGYWLNRREDVTDLLGPDPDYVQIALGVWDFADVFGFPGTTANPSPVFDNVALYKYRIGGPALATKVIHTAQDGFPANGSIDPANADLLDIPFDMARDINTGDFVIDKGDSIIVDIASRIPGTAVTDIRMVWALKQNTALSFTEVQPSRLKDENFQDLGGGVWTGEVVADTSFTSAAVKIENRFFVDLPDEDLLHPGAVLHYYVQATDSDGRTSTLPMDTSGFGDFSLPANAGYDRAFTVRGLPTLAGDGSQPELLVLNDFGRRGGEPSWTTAMHALGYEEGVHYDSYTVQGPESRVANGIGYATPGQLDGYHHVLYFAGNLSSGLLSNGMGNSSTNDKADDLAVLNDWLGDTANVRNIAFFGDWIGYSNTFTTEGSNFMSDVMGVDFLNPEVGPAIGGQTAPLIVPNPAAGIPAPGTFLTEYVAYGGCPTPSRFDQIQPLIGAEAGHWFTDRQGVPITEPSAGVASVIHDHGNGLAITFPYSSMVILDPVSRTAGPSARTQLLGEILDVFGSSGGAPPVTSAPEVRRSVLSLQPNPFNPSTLVSFSNTFGKRGSVKVYNLRGELVRTLHDGEFTQAEGFSGLWDGTDDGGASVASGVYVIQARADGQVESKKAALVK